MSDNESFISIENNNNDESSYSKSKSNVNLDNFLDYDIDYMNAEEKYKYIGADIIPRHDYFEVKNGKTEFFKKNNVKYENVILHNRKKEEADIFFKLKKELFSIAYRNYTNKLGNKHLSMCNKDSIDDTNKEKVGNTMNKIAGEGSSAETTNVKSAAKNKKTYDLLNNDLGVTLGNKIEDTYNEIKSSVNWLGNFFSNNEQNDEKKSLNIFYNDLYFVNDLTIIRFLDTHNYNLLKSLNKIIKFILWRQVSIPHFNNYLSAQGKLGKSSSNGKTGRGRSGSISSSVSSSGHFDNNNIFVDPHRIKEILLKANSFRCGFDLNSRPMLYIKILEKLNMHEDELFLSLVYHVDMCVNSVDYKKCYVENNGTNVSSSEGKKLDESSLQLVVVVDCLKFELNNMISVECIKKIITVFNEFYTDVLYRIYIINVPSFFKKVWSLFNMFIDNHTLKKIIFINKKNISMMYDHIDESVMKHIDRNPEKKCSEDSSVFFPSNSLYYKYDEMYYKKLVTYVDTWVDQMVKVNH
ncbi:conserved Plasmodium protein, unknown function [Plasmodium ovale wallikeri]|uniref:CRAL-TRIO domain-containing protein n=2 Tax=Plasmodium ovale TaxID=36330 RepID=A0A1A8YPP2_PLAOA|nr:conserved Plasmodium protein, unknown function [Plasmodium ovale wallikeri]SBT33962.1 conserved Plasmodium protein, unknown function [Plasmodium ovale wallikeri]SBT76401.1 conserved Plasmodium protein, unknown function [Plasmodium ovale]